MLCATCVQGYYPDSAGLCQKCATPETMAQTTAIVLVVGGIVGYLYVKYQDVLELFLDVGTLKIVLSYLMVTGSVSTSYNVQMPGFFKSFSSYANYVKFDPTSTLACLIMQFEFTFYHNVLLQATIPFVAFILVRGLVMLGLSQIRISYNNRRRIAQDDDELEYLENQEEKDRINLNEKATGLASEFLIFVHPNITEVMFNMFQCESILGYINQWLSVDLRFQCNDYGWWIFASIAFFMIVVYTLGLPIHYLVSLRRRRHRLDEAKSVVIKRYTAWRSHLKRAKDLRIPEDELAGYQNTYY